MNPNFNLNSILHSIKVESLVRTQNTQYTWFECLKTLWNFNIIFVIVVVVAFFHSFYSYRYYYCYYNIYYDLSLVVCSCSCSLPLSPTLRNFDIILEPTFLFHSHFTLLDAIFLHIKHVHCRLCFYIIENIIDVFSRNDSKCLNISIHF